MSDPIVLWDEVNPRLPIGQDPAGRQKRKDLFQKLLPKKHKTLHLDDAQKGIKAELRYDMAGTFVPGVTEMTKIIKLAFKASSELAPSTAAPKIKKEASTAKVSTGVQHKKGKKGDKDKGETVDRREFHAFLLSLRYYLEIAEVFEQCDGAHDDDQKLSFREAHKGMDSLTQWGVTEDMMKEKFAGVDPWVACIKFDDFAEWIMGIRMGNSNLKLDDSDDEEVQFLDAHAKMKDGVDLTFQDLGSESDLNMMKVKDTFAVWDSDGSGGISWEELYAVMKDLDPTFNEIKAKTLFAAADANQDGLIDFNEFVQFVFR